MNQLIGLRLKEARTRKNLTQVQVMELTNINHKTLSGYENCVSEPDLDTLTTLAKLYGVATDYLLGISETLNTKPDDDFHPTPDNELLIFYKARELSEESQKLIQEQVDHLYRLERERWERTKAERERETRRGNNDDK